MDDPRDFFDLNRFVPRRAEKTHVRKTTYRTTRSVCILCKATMLAFWRWTKRVLRLTLLQHWPGIAGASLGIWCTRHGR